MDKEIWILVKSDFLEVVSRSNKSELEIFLNGFLTPEEKVMIYKRLALYSLLLEGFNDQETKEILKLSYETVRSARQLVSLKEEAFKNLLKKKVKQMETDSKSNKLLGFIYLATKSKSDVKARAKLLSGDY